MAQRATTLTIMCALLTTACATKEAPPVQTMDTGGSTDARQIVHDMAHQLATADGFRVTINSNYDALQQDGQSITFADQRIVSLQRPDHLRVDSTSSDGKQGMVLSDGKAITVFKPQDKAYARIDKKGTVDDAVVYLVKDMQMTLPLARLLLTTLPQELDRLTTQATYVERDVLFEVPTDHVALRSADVDVQLWVTRTTQRVPRRIVITYKDEPGQPQFRADLTDWNLQPQFDTGLFIWTAPSGVERIAISAPPKPAPAKPVSTKPASTKKGKMTKEGARS